MKRTRTRTRTTTTGITAMATLIAFGGIAFGMKYPASQPLPDPHTQQPQQPRIVASQPIAAPPANPIEPATQPTRPIAEDVRPIIESGQPRVQIAILLDNSGSMSGLINQARTELWKVVNEFIKAKVDGKAPHLEVALFTYGSPPPKLVVPLTDNLDRVSEELFKVTISGGSEFCGMTIDHAINQLSWAEGGNDLKLIFIAGNEPFTQGPMDYRQACSAAIAKGIIVNTIHCGNGIPDDWADGARLADGKAMNINHNVQVVHIDAPQDAEIARLGVELNNTYIPFGARGDLGAARQAAQDTNAEAAAPGVAVQRAVTKGSAYYSNSAWDLVDAVKDKKVDLAKVDADQLPKKLREMSAEDRAAYVKQQGERRAELQTKIQQLNAEREKFVAAKRAETAEGDADDTLDAALIKAIREKATTKGYKFEK